LPGAQQELLDRLAATETPLVVVVMAGRPLTIQRALEQASAVVYAWHPGTEAGPALADVLLGDRAPTGKLPISFPRATGQIPVYHAHKNTGRPPQSSFRGVPQGTPLDPVGFETSYLDLENTPLFPFGFGLSYTSFAFDELTVTPDVASVGESIGVSVRVTNTGKRQGCEVVQLYLRDLVASVTRPVRELKDFERVELEAGESRTVSFTLRADQLSFTGPDRRRRVEPGKFSVFVGADANASLGAQFELR
jgi:beta-glucosidase